MTRTWHRKHPRPPMRTGGSLAGIRRLMHWEPFLDRDVARVAREAEPVFHPNFDVLETAECYAFLADLPGVARDRLEVAWSAGAITVSGIRDPEPLGQGADFYALERTFGAFTRSFSLPAGAQPDQAQATLKDGVLTVVVPKLPAGAAGQVPVQESRPDGTDVPVVGG